MQVLHEYRAFLQMCAQSKPVDAEAGATEDSRLMMLGAGVPAPRAQCAPAVCHVVLPAA